MNTPIMPTNVENIKVPEQRVTHVGEFEILPGVVLEGAIVNGERGFIQRQMAKSLGFTEKTRGGRFEAFLAKIGINALNKNGNPEWPFSEVKMPSGKSANWVHWRVLPDIINSGAKAYYKGELTKHQHHIGERCADLAQALVGVGLVALIDEATGYQYAREPDALQDLITRLIREKAKDWELTFHPDYYASVCKMLGVPYGNKHKPLPPLVGKITRDWVYDVVLPTEIMNEVKTRKKSEKLHQWLEVDGLKLLKAQIREVATIARTSVDYRDFEARASQAFIRPGQQVKMSFPKSGEAA